VLLRLFTYGLRRIVGSPLVDGDGILRHASRCELN